MQRLASKLLKLLLIWLYFISMSSSFQIFTKQQEGNFSRPLFLRNFTENCLDLLLNSFANMLSNEEVPCRLQYCLYIKTPQWSLKMSSTFRSSSLYSRLLVGAYFFHCRYYEYIFFGVESHPSVIPWQRHPSSQFHIQDVV